MKAPGLLGADQQPQTVDDPRDPQVVVIVAREPPARGPVEPEHALGGFYQDIARLRIGANSLDLGSAQNRRLRLGSTAGLEGEQPLDVIVNLLQPVV